MSFEIKINQVVCHNGNAMSFCMTKPLLFQLYGTKKIIKMTGYLQITPFIFILCPYNEKTWQGFSPTQFYPK